MQSKWWIDAMLPALASAGLLLSVLISRRDLLRVWPSLFVYGLLTICTQLTYPLLRPHYGVYFYTFWAVSALKYILRFWILADCVRSTPLLAHTPRLLAHCILAFAALISGVAAIYEYSNPASVDLRLATAVILGMRAANVGLYFFGAVAVLLATALGFSYPKPTKQVLIALYQRMAIAYFASFLLGSKMVNLRWLGNGLDTAAETLCVILWANAMRTEPLPTLTPEEHAALEAASKLVLEAHSATRENRHELSA